MRIKLNKRGKKALNPQSIPTVQEIEAQGNWPEQAPTSAPETLKSYSRFPDCQECGNNLDVHHDKVCPRCGAKVPTIK